MRDSSRNSTLEHAGSGSMSNPADGDNPGMLAVGAAPWYDLSEPEPFSSRGPAPDGRIKPDIVAADGGLAFVEYGRFFGTSQSSPHAAGMAALVKGRYPDMAPSQIARYLKDQALPKPETPGGALAVPNNAWGHGFARMPDSPVGISAGRALPIAGGADAGDALGYSVAMSADGDTIVAGAPTADVGAAQDAGAAYVFIKTTVAGVSSWTHKATLTAPTADVGAAQDAGAAYVFIKTTVAGVSSWTHKATLTAPTAAAKKGAAHVLAKPEVGRRAANVNSRRDGLR